MTSPRGVLCGSSDGVRFDIGRSNAAGRPGPCGDMTFRQKPRPASGKVQCLGEMPWYAGRLRSSPTAHKSYKAERESSAVWFRLLHHELYQIPRLEPVLVAQAVEHAKPLGRAIGHRHAPGELFDR